MRADAEHAALSELTALFAQYGVEPFLESTSLLVGLLNKDGNILLWNPSFIMLKQTFPDKKHLRDFLSSPSQAIFHQLLSTALRERTRTRGNLEFVHKGQNRDFASLFIPLPGERLLFIGEPVASDLDVVTAELLRTKHILTIKETELKAVIAQADEIAHTDALTFLPNRRQIIGDLQREAIFSDRYGTPLAISMVDVDHFKKINDTYGHTVGDKVLQSLADELREHIRHPDTIGRYGGEEFLIVLPHSTIKAAMEQAERLCKYIRSLLIKADDHEISMTISIGVAQYKIHKEDWEGFLSRADAALYEAKNNGRDQWAVSKEQR